MTPFGQQLGQVRNKPGQALDAETPELTPEAPSLCERQPKMPPPQR